MVPWVDLWSVIVPHFGHTHLFFFFIYFDMIRTVSEGIIIGLLNMIVVHWILVHLMLVHLMVVD